MRKHEPIKVRQARFYDGKDAAYIGSKMVVPFSDGMILFITKDQEQYEKITRIWEKLPSYIGVDEVLEKIVKEVGINPYVICSQEKIVETSRDCGDFPEGEKKDGHT